MSTKSGDAFRNAAREAERKYKAEQARQKKIARLKASWVAGSELTPEQLAAIQPNLKAAFYEREARRAA